MEEARQFGPHLRQIRQQRRISQRALAEAAGIAVSFCARIESGKASPTLATLMKLAEALGVSVVELLTPLAQPPELLTVVPMQQMPVVDDGEKRWRYLLPHHPRFRVVLVDEMYEPQTQHAEVEHHPHDICGVVLSGELTLEIPLRPPVSVRQGDTFYIAAGTPHIARNDSEVPVRLISVELPETREDSSPTSLSHTG